MIAPTWHGVPQNKTSFFDKTSFFIWLKTFEISLWIYFDPLIFSKSCSSVILICLTRPFAEKMNKNDNIVTNSNAIIGKEGVATKDITPNDVGQVKVSGDIWTAVSAYTDIIPKGSTIKVLSIDGVKLVVEPVTIKQPEKKI